MHPNLAKQRLKEGRLALGLGLRQARTVDIASAAATCGFDWLFIDMEHNAMSVDTAAQIAAAAPGMGVTPIVRVPGHEHYHATRLLDNGAQGIVAPHVDDAAQARRIAEACLYPPLGKRSIPGLQPQLAHRRAADHQLPLAHLHQLPLAGAPLDDVLKAWAGLGYYARGRNLHACAQAVMERHGGRFPATVVALSELPGVGPYTAAAIAAIAFDEPATPVDGNIERVIARLFAVEDELPGAKPKIRRLAADLTPARRAGDFAQAMMDLGATLCTPKKPACGLCPLNENCMARRRGAAETFPRKPAKRTGKLRRGAAFVVLRADGHLLVRTRPTEGLLGGMTEVPTNTWTHEFADDAALAAAPRLAGTQWRRVPGVVTHVFTHFPLELVVHTASVGATVAPPPGMRWVALAEVAGEALPNVMRKVLAHAGVV